MKYFLLLLLSLFIFQTFSQKGKIYIATINTNPNVEGFIHAVAPKAILVDFSKIDKKKWSSTFKKCSGLVLTGGPDVNPTRYGKTHLTTYCNMDVNRDKMELELIEKALNDSLPILGLCRGMQILNVYFNGELCADIPSFCQNPTTIVQHRDPRQQNDVTHSISIEKNTALHAIFQADTMTVNSWHHQVVSVVGKNLKITAKSPDGLPEAMEWEKGLSNRWVLAVQWHPERYFTQHSEQLKLAESFIAAIKKRQLK